MTSVTGPIGWAISHGTLTATKQPAGAPTGPATGPPGPAGPHGSAVCSAFATTAPRPTARLTTGGVHERLLLAAVDLDHGAVHEVREWGREVRTEVGDFLDLRDATERDATRRELVRGLVAELHVARHRAHEPIPPLRA